MALYSNFSGSFIKYKLYLMASIFAPLLIMVENAVAQLETDAATLNPTIEEAIVFGRGAQQALPVKARLAGPI